MLRNLIQSVVKMRTAYLSSRNRKQLLLSVFFIAIESTLAQDVLTSARPSAGSRVPVTALPITNIAATATTTESNFVVTAAAAEEETTQFTTTEQVQKASTPKHSMTVSTIAEDLQSCPAFNNETDDFLTQDQFSTKLTNPCRYDRLTKPKTNGPLNVSIQIDIKHIEAEQQLKFKMHMLVQFRYKDDRLAFRKYSPQRPTMLGEELLKNKIWVPHIQLYNERDSAIMGMGGLGKDIFVSISPDGDVSFSYRMYTTIYCWMDLRKFPFDEQTCNLYLKSWTYNASELMLYWEDEDAVKVASQLHLTEFSFGNYELSSTLQTAGLTNGAFVGNYSVLVFKFLLSRQVGFYIMDYFLPSIMLVITSWVTFWLQADNTAPRVTLGTSTMLSFITLASGQYKTIPKVSYIKASEIWFLGCIIFIFASICEFAFVNIIWRRKKKIELKKVNSKYILKSALTPRLARKELQRSSSMNNLHKSHSLSSLDGNSQNSFNKNPEYNHYLTVSGVSNIMKVPTIKTESADDLIPPGSVESITTINIPSRAEELEGPPMHQSWTTMTPQEMACWIDKRSRLLFPILFLIFNIVYWSFVYAL